MSVVSVSLVLYMSEIFIVRNWPMFCISFHSSLFFLSRQYFCVPRFSIMDGSRQEILLADGPGYVCECICFAKEQDFIVSMQCICNITPNR